jgi:hypothetical protein
MLDPLVHFPFKGMPMTNSAIFWTGIAAVGILLYFLL